MSKTDIYRSFEQWKNGNVLEHGVPRTEYYSAAQLDLVEMGWNYGYDAGRAVEQSLDKKAENARELGLDYEVEPKIGCVNHDCDKCKGDRRARQALDEANAYALELQARLVKYERGETMTLNTAPQPPAPVPEAHKPLPLPPGRCASEWGGRATGPCLYTDDEVFEILAAHGIKENT